MKDYPSKYWDVLYKEGKIGWDVGYAATPLADYIDQLTDKSIRILVPGAGNGWEVEYLYKNGFVNTFMLDFSEEAISSFKKRFPDFPEAHIIKDNFFIHKDLYDLIVEQTFFSSLPKVRRGDYVRQIHSLLKPGGKLVGLFFNHEFPFDKPPFGGTPKEYANLFNPWFKFIHFSTAYNSIKPRKSRELFILLLKD